MTIHAMEETIRRRQAAGCTVCPRCGRSMKPRLHANALSRQLAVYMSATTAAWMKPCGTLPGILCRWKNGARHGCRVESKRPRT